MDRELIRAIESIHPPDGWVHFSTIGPDGGPHVTPMMMGIHDTGLLFSVTGQQKKRNLERDSRACVAISQPGVMTHVIVWGTVELRHDETAQQMWNEMISSTFGDAGLKQRARTLSIDATSLGVMTPTHHRIYGLT